MKKIIAYIVLLSGLMGLGACEKELPDYSETNGIYFAMAANDVKVDTTKITFAFAAPTVKDTVLKVLVRILGNVVNKDRSFKLKVVKENTTAREGIHFEALQETYTIPAGANSFPLPVKFKRAANLLTDTVQLQIELQENEHFRLRLVDEIINTTTKQKVSLIRYTMRVSDVIAKPIAWWDYMLGTFSRKKILFISELTGEPLAGFNDRNIMTIPKLTYLGKFNQKYLNDQKAAGNVILDEDGLPMTMGAGAQ